MILAFMLTPTYSVSLLHTYTYIHTHTHTHTSEKIELFATVGGGKFVLADSELAEREIITHRPTTTLIS